MKTVGLLSLVLLLTACAGHDRREDRREDRRDRRDFTEMQAPNQVAAMQVRHNEIVVLRRAG